MDDSGERPERHDEEPVVPGVVLYGRRYDAGAGEVWAGRIERLGADVTVRHVRLPADPLLRDDALSEAERLLDIRHPHLTSVTDVIRTPDGLAVVAEPVPGAISLSRLLGVRGRLDPGEVVTIGLPMAQALTEAHDAGLTHGRLSALDILLEANGRPVLAGVGLAAFTDPGVTASDDVHDLADLLLGAMRQATGPDAAAVAVAVATALIDDPRRRPSAAELAAGLARSATPLPVRMTADGADASVPALDIDAALSGSRGDSATVDDLDPSSLDAADAGWYEPPEGGAGQGPAATEDDVGGDGHTGADGSGGEGGGEGAGSRRDGRTAPADPSELVGSLRPPGRERAGGRERVRPSGRGAGTGRFGGRPAGAGRNGPGRVRVPGGRPRPREAGRDPAGAGGGPARGGPHGRGPRRRMLLPLVAVVGLVITAIAAVLLATGSNEPAGRDTPAADGSPTRDDPGTTPVSGRSPEQVWRDVLGELNTARSTAFERADEAGLDGVYAPGSAALRADQENIRRMVEMGGHSSPVRVEIVDLSVRSETEGDAVLRVTEVLAPYDFLDAEGRVLARQPASPAATRDITLRRTEAGWRIAGSEPVTVG